MYGLRRGTRVRILGAHLALLLGVLLLAGACATPIGVSRADTQSLYRLLTRSVLSAGEPSAPTEQLLHQLGLENRFEEDPAATLAQLRGAGAEMSPDLLFALAELSFLHAERERSRDYYLAAPSTPMRFWSMTSEGPPTPRRPIRAHGWRATFITSV